jgi:folate-binding protein YgfZ
LATASRIAKLEQYGLLQAAGADARAFLHAQLTNDIENLPASQARYAGWCSAKGRLLATFLVIPFSGGFLLQLAHDLVPAVLKRLSMFVLRSKVTLSDATGQWQQYGVWEESRPGEPQVREEPDRIAVRIDAQRALLLSKQAMDGPVSADEWALAEVRSGRVLITQATQDQFVPQMVNLELAGGVDFHKGCYPGQEIVARAQYRGAVKRRLYRVRGASLKPGQDLYTDQSPEQATGMVVNTAGDESLAVLSIDAAEAKAALHARPASATLEILPLSYPQ